MIAFFILYLFFDEYEFLNLEAEKWLHSYSAPERYVFFSQNIKVQYYSFILISMIWWKNDFELIWQLLIVTTQQDLIHVNVPMITTETAMTVIQNVLIAESTHFATFKTLTLTLNVNAGRVTTLLGQILWSNVLMKMNVTNFSLMTVGRREIFASTHLELLYALVPMGMKGMRIPWCVSILMNVLQTLIDVLQTFLKVFFG